MPSPCLTDAQIAEVRAAAPGRAPEALARHLGSCEACQVRALFGERRPRRPPRRQAKLPSLRRGLLLAALVLAAILAFVWTLQKLAGDMP